MAYTNADGLYVKFHKEIATKGKGGYVVGGDSFLHTVELRINAVDLADAEAIQGDGIVIPAGAVIEQIEVVAETACTSSGSATLDLGLIRQDRSTVYDADGLAADIALSSLNVAGEKVTLTAGVATAGALVGTTLANSGLITASYETAAFTAGVLVVRVRYYKA